jgi:hypothetical protein
MRKKLLVLFSVLVFGASPAFAFAVEPASTIGKDVVEVKNAMRTQLADARTAFKEKLAAIKDVKKQTIAENLDSRINAINKKRTDEMSLRLDRLSSILSKISTKGAALKAQGKNTGTLDAKITAAQAQLDAAKQAVTDQAAKDYVLVITTDPGLKNAASTLIRQFMTDIKAVHSKVVAAQLSVVKIYKEIGLLMGDKPTPTSAVSPSPTP